MNTCKYCLLIPLLIVVNSVTCRTIYMELNTPTSEELNYLKRYGYLPEEQGDVDFAYTPHSISDAVRRLQDFAGLPKTGTLDDKTRSLFSKRRCGVKDIESAANRRRRYIIQDGWGKRIITYKVVNGSSTMPKSRIDILVAKGLAIWAPHGNLQFDRVDSGKADIVISFVRGKHGDGFPFDGRGRVVAHAFPPPFGVLHFDDDELWGDNPEDDKEDVTDFFAVAVHEIGHALGLSHSKVKESVMYPYYQVPVERLHIDDIMGMQELYLKDQKPEEAELVSTDSPLITQSSFVPRFTKPNEGSDEENVIPDLCYTNYDTVQVIQGKIFVFEEEWMWVLPRRKVIEVGYPKRFHDVFVGLPKDISAIRTIYEKRNGNIAIFSGKKYWEFDSSFNFVRRGRLSEYSIPSYVSELTTVFLSNYNNKTYLIEYERFWRYDEDTRLMDEGYPKDMSAWRQVPYPVDAAVIWQNDTYFFHGPRFWRFDNELVRAHEYYPLPTAQIWFPCQSNYEMDKYTINDGP